MFRANVTATGLRKEEREGERRLDRRLDRDNVVESWLHVLECQGNERRKIRLREGGQEGR